MEKKKQDFTVKVYPSLLAFDFGALGEEAKRMEKSGADGIHVDIMDGHFVPNLTLGPRALGAVNRSTSLFLDLHLMIYNPYDYIEAFVEMGADQITFHIESTEDVKETLLYIKKCKVKAGLALSPESSPELLTPYLPLCDQILIMTVKPGFGGQAFLEERIEAIQFISEARRVRNLDFDIEVDGGIDLATALSCKKAGANVFVAGTYLAKQSSLATAIKEVKEVLK